jgi:hypothetical protein
MNARETYNAIESGNQKDAQQALFQLLAMVQELSTATLEMAHSVKQLIGRDPLDQRSRLWLGEFLELPRRKRAAIKEQGTDAE